MIHGYCYLRISIINMSFKSDTDLEYLRDRQRHFRGRAKVKLNNLRFLKDDEGCREIDAKNVSRLVGVFGTQGCLRLEEENYVPACISDSTLDSALHQSALESQQLLAPNDPPFLELGDQQLTCLHGRHRIEAARLFLGPFEEWWIVDLYNDGMLPPSR